MKACRFLSLAFVGLASVVLAGCEVLSDGSSSDGSSGTGGSMARFTCVGNQLYVVDDEFLQAFDISDSSKITRTARIVSDWSNRIETVFATDSLLFLGSNQGMYIFGLTHPASPNYISLYTHVTSCDPVVVQGKYAYVTLHTDNQNLSCSQGVNQLEVIDLSSLQSPKNKGVYAMTNPKGLAIDGTTLFVCDGMDLVVMDAGNPLQLVETKRIELDGTPYDVIAKNGLLTVSYSAGLRQYAYSDGNLTELSNIY